MKLKICISIVTLLIISCINGSEVDPQPYVPDTDAIPSVTLKFDNPLSANTVHYIGVFGVIENGGGFDEVATEVELHLEDESASIYAITDGVVMYIQPPMSGAQAGEVEGVWVRYGKNFLVKYVHVINPAVVKGQIITVGDRIGSTASDGQGRGLWEVEVNVKEGGAIYARSLYDYCDEQCKLTLDLLWDNPDIGRIDGAFAPFKALELYDHTAETSIFF